MSDSAATVIVALIAFLGTVMGSYLANSKTIAVMEERMSAVKGDIADLKARVDRHNNLVERVALLEQSDGSQWRELDRIKGGKAV